MVYRPTARVLTILELLQSHGRMTGAEVARWLEVDIRKQRPRYNPLLYRSPAYLMLCTSSQLPSRSRSEEWGEA